MYVLKGNDTEGKSHIFYFKSKYAALKFKAYVNKKLEAKKEFNLDMMGLDDIPLGERKYLDMNYEDYAEEKMEECKNLNTRRKPRNVRTGPKTSNNKANLPTINVYIAETKEKSVHSHLNVRFYFKNEENAKTFVDNINIMIVHPLEFNIFKEDVRDTMFIRDEIKRDPLEFSYFQKNWAESFSMEHAHMRR